VTSPDRKYRTQRTTALTCGAMAETVLGAMLVVWSTGAETAETAPLGLAMSFGVVVAAMAAVAVAMIALLLAARLSQPVLMTAVAVEVLLAGGVGTVALAMLVTDPGLALMLGLGCAMTFPVAWQITRTPRGG
jgi:hypothetical protein